MDYETATYIANGGLEIGFYSVFATGQDGHLPFVVAGQYVGTDSQGLVFNDRRRFAQKDTAMDFCVEKNIKRQVV